MRARLKDEKIQDTFMQMPKEAVAATVVVAVAR